MKTEIFKKENNLSGNFQQTVGYNRHVKVSQASVSCVENVTNGIL